METGTLSWNSGPTESRFVRTLAYLVVGVPVGVLLALLVVVGPELVVALVDGVEPRDLWFLVVFVVLAAPKLWASVHARRARKERSRLAREWSAVGVWRWGVVTSLLFGSLLVGAETAFEVGLVQHAHAYVYGALFVGAVFSVFAVFLGSVGEIDPADLTLSYGDREGIDLRYLLGVKRLTVGQYTVLWLRFGPGVNHERAQNLYAMPTEVVERAWPVFERGIASETSREESEKSDLLRRVNVLVAFIFVGGSVGLLAVLIWLGAPAWELLQWGWITAGLAFFFLRFFARTA